MPKATTPTHASGGVLLKTGADVKGIWPGSQGQAQLQVLASQCQHTRVSAQPAHPVPAAATGHASHDNPPSAHPCLRYRPPHRPLLLLLWLPLLQCVAAAGPRQLHHHHICMTSQLRSRTRLLAKYFQKVLCPNATTTCSGLWRSQLANSLTRRRMQSMLSALLNSLEQSGAAGHRQPQLASTTRGRQHVALTVRPAQQEKQPSASNECV